MLILASTSPQRHKLLKDSGLRFKVHHPLFEERLDPNLSPSENVKQLALGKARSINHHYPKNWVIGVDTIVVCETKIIGKAENEKEAFQIIKKLAGKTHQVISGIALVKGEKEYVEVETTLIEFASMTKQEIQDFIDSGAWKGKSGAFTIQKHGAFFIKGITGDYYNVVGLPLYRLGRMLRNYCNFIYKN